MGKVYIGDAVYAERDQFDSIVLTTEDGIRATNRIVMEPEVLADFLRYLSSLGIQLSQFDAKK